MGGKEAKLREQIRLEQKSRVIKRQTWRNLHFLQKVRTQHLSLLLIVSPSQIQGFFVLET